MKSKKVINAKSPCIGAQVPSNDTKNSLAFLCLMTSALVSHVGSNKYIILSQGTCAIRDNNFQW